MMPATSLDDKLMHLNKSSDSFQTVHWAKKERNKYINLSLFVSPSPPPPLPLTVSITMDGGFIGYSGGNRMRP